MAVVAGGNAVSRQDVYNSFRSQGLTHNQAANFAGVTANEGGYRGGLYTGSFGNQSTENGGVLNSSGAYGIAQWNGPRQAGLANYAAANGMQPSDLNAQTGFAVQEARQRGINLDSTSDIVNRFEVPRADLRAGEIARSNQVASTFDPSSYTGQSTNGLSASSDGQTQAAGGVETSTGGRVISEGTDANGNATVVFGNEDGTVPPANPNTTASSTAGAGQTGQQNSAAGTSSSSGSGSGGGGFGAFMTDVGRAIGNALAPATQGAGKAVASATDNVAKATTQSGTTIAKGSTDAATIAAKQAKADTTVAADSAKDYFGRIVIIVLGIVFVGGGVAMFVFNKNPVSLVKNAVT